MIRPLLEGGSGWPNHPLWLHEGDLATPLLFLKIKNCYYDLDRPFEMNSTPNKLYCTQSTESQSKLINVTPCSIHAFINILRYYYYNLMLFLQRKITIIFFFLKTKDIIDKIHQSTEHKYIKHIQSCTITSLFNLQL